MVWDTETANNAYETSRTGTSLIVDAIKGKGSFSMLDHNNTFVETVSSMHCNIRHQDQATQDSILSTFDAKKKRAFRRSIDGKTAWLAVLPLSTHHFNFLQ